MLSQGNVRPNYVPLPQIEDGRQTNAGIGSNIDLILNGFRFENFPRIGMLACHPPRETFWQVAVRLLREAVQRHHDVADVRYVVMSLNSFTEQPYCDLPECFAGWMARQHANSGEIFEPKTVQDKIDVAANTRICLPAILDLWEGNVIWADIALRKHPSWNNVKNNLSGVSVMARALTSLVKTDLHTLFSLHIN